MILKVAFLLEGTRHQPLAQCVIILLLLVIAGVLNTTYLLRPPLHIPSDIHLHDNAEGYSG